MAFLRGGPLRCWTILLEVRDLSCQACRDCIDVGRYYLALVLAPFFVHLEILFKLGYRPAMHRQLQKDVGVEILKFRKTKGDEKRAAEQRVL